MRAYDHADRRSTLTLPNGIVTSYGYDDSNQLTSLVYGLGQTTLGTLTFTYDLAGRRTEVGAPGRGRDYRQVSLLPERPGRLQRGEIMALDSQAP